MIKVGIEKKGQYKKLWFKALLLAFLFNTGFIISFFLIHILNSDLDFIRFPLSRYALTSNGFIIQSGFYMVGLAEWIIAFYFFTFSPKTQKLSSIFLLMAGAGVIAAGAYPMDLDNQHTVHGTIHTYAATIQFLFFPLSLFFYSVKNKQVFLLFFSRTTGILTTVLAVIIAMIVTEDNFYLTYYGLVQKVDILFITLWIAIISYSMMRGTKKY